MTQKEKDLLFKDLCSRLPYGVKCENFNQVYGKNVFKVTDVRDNGCICGTINNQHSWTVFDPLELKPYLFPLSSMTEEQKEDLLIHVLGKKDCKLFQVLSDGSIDSTGAKLQELAYFNFRWVNFDSETTSAYIDWCNKNHIDYRNLISKNLAIDATGLNIY